MALMQMASISREFDQGDGHNLGWRHAVDFFNLERG